MKLIISYIILGMFLALGISYGQELIFYKLNSLERPYVISRRYNDPVDNADVSEVIEAKAIFVMPAGTKTELMLSNAVIFITEIPSNMSTNPAVKVNQQVATVDKFVLPLDSQEKIIFNRRILEIKNYGSKEVAPPDEEYSKVPELSPVPPPGLENSK